MKVTELRIGNFVYGINRRSEIHLPDYNPCKVLQIELFNTEILPIEQNPAIVEKWFRVANPDLSPIPLTEEWLLKFGFYFDLKTDYDGYWKKYKEGFEIRIYKFEDYFEYGWQLGHDPIKIKYVHHLQNLYYVLTGGELTIH